MNGRMFEYTPGTDSKTQQLIAALKATGDKLVQESKRLPLDSTRYTEAVEQAGGKVVIHEN